MNTRTLYISGIIAAAMFFVFPLGILRVYAQTNSNQSGQVGVDASAYLAIRDESAQASEGSVFQCNGTTSNSATFTFTNITRNGTPTYKQMTNAWTICGQYDDGAGGTNGNPGGNIALIARNPGDTAGQWENGIGGTLGGVRFGLTTNGTNGGLSSKSNYKYPQYSNTNCGTDASKITIATNNDATLDASRQVATFAASAQGCEFSLTGSVLSVKALTSDPGGTYTGVFKLTMTVA